MQPPYPKQDDYYIVSPEVIHEGELLGIEDVVNSVRYMIKYSAPITDPRGNRRYREFVFMVRNGNYVESISQAFAKQGV